jgi:hypothetical protein
VINWKAATKEYRLLALQAMKRFRREQYLRTVEEEVVKAAQSYVWELTAPRNPFVKLVTGQDVNVQKAQQNLVDSVQNLDKFIQTYSQNPDQNPPSENLDNPASV